jgi:hypothetical protein
MSLYKEMIGALIASVKAGKSGRNNGYGVRMGKS